MYSFIASPTASFVEVYQDSDLKFACCQISKEDKTIRQLHDFVKCRDFLNDALIATKQGKKSKVIYGFSFDGNKNPMNLKRFEMLLRGEDFDILQENLEILNNFETSIGARKTTLKRIKGSDTIKLVLASPLWLRSTVMISLYTHILRCLSQYQNPNDHDLIEFLKICGNKEGNAGSYQRTINKIDFEKLLRNARKVFNLKESKLPDYSCDGTSIQTIHDRGGIVTFSEHSLNSELCKTTLHYNSVQRFHKL